MTFMWMVLFLVLIVLEIVTVGLISIWFALGALASFVSSFWIDSIWIQLGIFVGVSAISLLLTRKIVAKFRINDSEKTNLDRVIGKIGIVTEDIDKLAVGEVKVDGKKWSAISDKKINVGSKVEILSIDGVKLKVKEVKEDD